MGFIKKNKGFFALLTDGLLLALFGLFTRIMNNYMGSYMQVVIRMFLVALMLFPFILLNKSMFKGLNIKNFWLFAIFIFSFPIYVLFFTLSVNSFKIADSFFYIFISSTIISYIIGNIYFKEKVEKKEIIVSTLLLAGLFLFAFPLSSIQKINGMITGLISGFFWGISNATRKFYDGKINRWLVIFIQMLVGTIICFALALLSKNTGIHNWSWIATIVILLYALGNIVVQMLLFIGLKNFDLNLSSVVLASQLVFVMIVGIIFLKEIPTLLELSGAILVSLAIVLSKVNLIEA